MTDSRQQIDLDSRRRLAFTFLAAMRCVLDTLPVSPYFSPYYRDRYESHYNKIVTLDSLGEPPSDYSVTFELETASENEVLRAQARIEVEMEGYSVADRYVETREDGSEWRRTHCKVSVGTTGSNVSVELAAAYGELLTKATTLLRQIAEHPGFVQLVCKITPAERIEMNRREEQRKAQSVIDARRAKIAEAVRTKVKVVQYGKSRVVRFDEIGLDASADPALLIEDEWHEGYENERLNYQIVKKSIISTGAVLVSRPEKVVRETRRSRRW